jgi:hypothetical protein
MHRGGTINRKHEPARRRLKQWLLKRLGGVSAYGLDHSYESTKPHAPEPAADTRNLDRRGAGVEQARCSHSFQTRPG